MIKAMLVPFILIICFGGGMVFMTKPFNPKAVAVMGGLLVSVLVFGYAPFGLLKLGGALGLLVSLYALYAIRGKK